MILLSVAIVLLGVFCIVQFPVGDYDFIGFSRAIKLGLDLKGGVYAVFEIEEKDDTTDEAINGTVEHFKNVLFKKGYTEAVVTVQDQKPNRKIRVEVPDENDPSTILSLIGTPAHLEFKADDNATEAYVTGKDVENAYAGYDQNNQPVVVLKFNSAGAEKFKKATEERKDQTLGIYINGSRIANPTVNDVISTGEATITGVGDYAACTNLALQIQGGSFDVDFKGVSESRTVSPTLGQNALTKSIIAAVIGMVLIMAFMCFMYRAMGAAASLALTAYVVLTIILLATIPWVQLTLSGIGGIILGIGMAVDANVVIFERIKDEYEKGKPIPAAVAMGFKRAGRAIIDSNLTTIIGALALLLFGPTTLRSFAITLMISIVLSFLTALLLTRGILKCFLALNSKDAKLYNLRTEQEGYGRVRKAVEKFKKIKITEKYKRWFFIPAGIAAVSLIVFVGVAIASTVNGGSPWDGIRRGIDFTGGSILTVDYTDAKIDISGAGYDNESDYLTSVVESKGYSVSLVQKSGDTVITVRYQNNDNKVNEEIIQALYDHYHGISAGYKVNNADAFFISASSSSQLILRALFAVAIALLATLAYIAIRFKWRYGIAAVLTLIHDVVLLVAITIIMRFQVNASFIAALVTIIGYSVNNVIIIFDRIRENITFLESKTKYDPFKLADASIGNSITRSVYTTMTTLITIVAMAILGENTMREFAVPIIIGLLIGLYSSAVVAPSIWALLVRNGMKRAAAKADTLPEKAEKDGDGNQGGDGSDGGESKREEMPAEAPKLKPAVAHAPSGGIGGKPAGGGGANNKPIRRPLKNVKKKK